MLVDGVEPYETGDWMHDATKACSNLKYCGYDKNTVNGLLHALDRNANDKSTNNNVIRYVFK
jgi:hypothetical protein